MLELDELKERLFEQQQENQRLRGQITYLQEELASVEDERDQKVAALKAQVETLEAQLGDALFGMKD